MQTVTKRLGHVLLVILFSVTALCGGERSIEELNLAGTVAPMPAIADTLLGNESVFRTSLFEKGWLFRANALPRFSVNTLDSGVPKDQQVYLGQRLTWITGLNPVFVSDLRQLGMRDAQFVASFGWRWTTWNPAGPKTTAVSSLYLYKAWKNRRIELKTGYLTNDLEFIGLQVGGASATAAQGVYAVLPYQLGMSYFPLTSPSFNLRLEGPKHFYWKGAAQRSLDAAGGLATITRNHTGLRFAPKGDGLLVINEGGYQRPASPTARQVWLRAGYMFNTTEYTNKLTGGKEAGNYCYYTLMDYQLTSPNSGRPAHGLYLGGSVMAVPSRFNSYDRYYEGRFYQKAPFHFRPDDMLSALVTYRGHSKVVTNALRASGKTAWDSSPAVTFSYAAHISRGTYLSIGLGYVRGAAITPRVDDSLTFNMNWGFYF